MTKLSAELLARSLHKDQKMWDGTDYVKHLEYIVSQLVSDSEKIVGWLYGSIESPEIDLEYLRSQNLDSMTIDALDSITRKLNEGYGQYIFRLSQNLIATKVKLKAVEHILLNLKEGSVRDKYLLTEIYLRDKLVEHILP